MANILIIDDDRMMAEMLSRKVSRLGHGCQMVFTLSEGLKQLETEAFDVVFLDVGLPDGNGLDILPDINAIPNAPEVVIITGAGDPDGAELAIQSGVWDYIEKASSLNAMILPLTRALQYREEKQQRKAPMVLLREGIIGNSPQIRSMLEMVAQAATTDTNVLITGETGTGKELFANAIHLNSTRADQNFVVVDCAALPDTLVESMLFGHVKGAFTGADKSREGLILQADGGTLFLDEIGELPMSLQKAFLRVLQERRFRPIGSHSEVTSNFRLIAATNRNLQEMVQAGSFREDLLFRLRSFPIELPPLRVRKSDIKDLIVHYSSKICEKFNIPPKGFSPELLEILTSYDWPGNVREFINTLERGITAAYQDHIIYPKHLPTHFRVHIARSSVEQGQVQAQAQVQTEEISGTGLLQSDRFPSYKEYREQVIADMDQRYLQDLMTLAKSDIKEACRLADLSRSRLYSLLKAQGFTDRNDD